MNKLLFRSGALAALIAGPAMAADIPAKAPLYSAPPPVLHNWTGIYFGGHIGYGATSKEWTTVDFFGVPAFQAGSGNVTGVLAGGQVGVNYQVGVMVFGVEADASWADISGQTCNLTSFVFVCTSKVDRFGTVAARIGGAVDRVLLYHKVGAAWVHDTHDWTFTAVTPFVATDSKNKWGWTAGAGIEYALTRNWSAKLEYDFMVFRDSRYLFVFTFPPPNTITADAKQRVHAVKFGWNYKFDWGGPVVASY